MFLHKQRFLTVVPCNNYHSYKGTSLLAYLLLAILSHFFVVFNIFLLKIDFCCDFGKP